jgi:hypothetical protein
MTTWSAHQKKRALIVTSALAGGGGLLFAYYYFVLAPLLAVSTQDAAAAATFRDQTGRARFDLRVAPAIQQECATLIKTLDTETNFFVLRPVLGSLLMGAQRIVEPLARECDLQFNGCDEVERTELPLRKSNGKRLFDRYVVEVSLEGSYVAVARFLDALERKNPYVCVNRLVIQGNAENPLRHKIALCLEWPVDVAEGRAAPPPIKKANTQPVQLKGGGIS